MKKIARDEKLNEEGARNPNIPPTANPKDLVFLNRLNDEEKQLPHLSGEKETDGVDE